MGSTVMPGFSIFTCLPRMLALGLPAGLPGAHSCAHRLPACLPPAPVVRLLPQPFFTCFPGFQSLLAFPPGDLLDSLSPRPTLGPSVSEGLPGPPLRDSFMCQRGWAVVPHLPSDTNPGIAVGAFGRSG